MLVTTHTLVTIPTHSIRRGGSLTGLRHRPIINLITMHQQAVTPGCCLTYNMGALGDEVYNFASSEEARDFQQANPPDILVRSTYLDQDGLRHFTPNYFFCWAAYDYSVAERQWRDGYFRRTGKVWNGSDDGESQEGSHGPFVTGGSCRRCRPRRTDRRDVWSGVARVGPGPS